jgi:hypothetical protein
LTRRLRQGACPLERTGRDCSTRGALQEAIFRARRLRAGSALWVCVDPLAQGPGREAIDDESLTQSLRFSDRRGRGRDAPSPLGHEGRSGSGGRLCWIPGSVRPPFLLRVRPNASSTIRCARQLWNARPARAQSEGLWKCCFICPVGRGVFSIHFPVPNRRFGGKEFS